MKRGSYEEVSDRFTFDAAVTAIRQINVATWLE